MTATTDDNPSATAAFFKLALLSIAAAAVLLAVGYLPTRNLAGPDGFPAACLGVGIVLAGMLIGHIPTALSMRRGPTARYNGMLAGMAIRFLIVLGLLLGAILSGAVLRVPLALWTAIGYIVLLAVDTGAVVWLTRQKTGTAP